MSDCTGGDTPGDGDCTVVSNCNGTAGCGGSSAGDPILPRCQDVSLVPGVFPNATVTVNAAGCISVVSQGEPEVYTPDECCSDSGGGEGSIGPRGVQGPAGSAATVSVEQAIGSGSAWTVQNVGTPSVAILRFTAPIATGGGASGSGTTGEVGGLEVNSGLVTLLPDSLVTSLTIVEQGFHTDKFFFGKVNEILPEAITVGLNLDALVDYIDAANNAAITRLNNLEDLTATHSSQISTINATLTSINNSLTAINSTLSSLDSRITALENP